MKTGINIHLPVQLKYDVTIIDSIEFIFKQQASPKSKVIKTSLYKSDNSGDTKKAQDDIFYIPWTAEDTYKFKSDADFFMDMRIHLKNSLDNPQTPIIKLRMNDSLFAEGEVVT